MIVEPKVARLIANGRRTQLRFKAETDQPRFRPGMTYGVKTKRGRSPICHVEIIQADLQELEHLTYQDARAEGHKSRDEFFAWWQERHPRSHPSDHVWAYAFRLKQPQRFLARRPAQGDRIGETRDYVTTSFTALRDEPEAVPLEWQQEASAMRQDVRNEWLQEELRVYASYRDEHRVEIRRKATGQLRRAYFDYERRLKAKRSEDSVRSRV